jgi:hypothetical protein
MPILSVITSPPVHSRTKFIARCDKSGVSGTAATREIECRGSKIMSNRSAASGRSLAPSEGPDAPDPVTALVVRARRGEQQAWDRLVDRYSPLLWFVARSHRLADQDAADAVQLTWLRCVEQLDRIREPARLARWLVGACQDECLRIRRLTTAYRPFGSAAPLGPLAVHEVISRLPERLRALLTALLDGGDDPVRIESVRAETCGSG